MSIFNRWSALKLAYDVPMYPVIHCQCSNENKISYAITLTTALAFESSSAAAAWFEFWDLTVHRISATAL